MFHLPIFANLSAEDRPMPEDKGQYTHAEQSTYTSPPPTDEVSFKWTGKSVAMAIGVCTLAGSFFTFTAVQYADGVREHQSIADRMDASEKDRASIHTQLSEYDKQLSAIAISQAKVVQQLQDLKDGQTELKAMLMNHMGRKE